jgi:DNA-binding response OmpR family regulator
MTTTGGRTHVLVKPFDLDQFCAALRQLVARQTLRQPRPPTDPGEWMPHPMAGCN